MLKNEDDLQFSVGDSTRGNDESQEKRSKSILQNQENVESSINTLVFLFIEWLYGFAVLNHACYFVNQQENMINIPANLRDILVVLFSPIFLGISYFLYGYMKASKREVVLLKAFILSIFANYFCINNIPFISQLGVASKHDHLQLLFIIALVIEYVCSIILERVYNPNDLSNTYVFIGFTLFTAVITMVLAFNSLPLFLFIHYLRLKLYIFGRDIDNLNNNPLNFVRSNLDIYMLGTVFLLCAFNCSMWQICSFEPISKSIARHEFKLF